MFRTFPLAFNRASTAQQIARLDNRLFEKTLRSTPFEFRQIHCIFADGPGSNAIVAHKFIDKFSFYQAIPLSLCRYHSRSAVNAHGASAATPSGSSSFSSCSTAMLTGSLVDSIPITHFTTCKPIKSEIPFSSSTFPYSLRKSSDGCRTGSLVNCTDIICLERTSSLRHALLEGISKPWHCHRSQHLGRRL